MKEPPAIVREFSISQDEKCYDELATGGPMKSSRNGFLA
jgi:hypothetical protein